MHGSASALAVVARTVGMLAGLSLLTAVALRRFTAEVDAIGTPFELCPDSPADCPVYDAATDAAILTQLHTVFAGAAIAAGLAAVAALLLLRSVPAVARGQAALKRTAGVPAAGRPRLPSRRGRASGRHRAAADQPAGPCTASSGGAPLDLGGPRQRAVLVVLSSPAARSCPSSG